jgi:TPP-dependent pyruvate/acetoin dehydrogenase alpha subunit
LPQLRALLERDHAFDAVAHDALVRALRAEIEAAITSAESAGPPSFASIFEDVYAEIPAHLRAQSQESSK